MKLAILFEYYGPYHRARVAAAARVADVLAVEFSASSQEYAWESDGGFPVRHAFVNPHGNSGELSITAYRAKLGAILDEFKPDAVALPGWSVRGAFLGAEWALQRKVPTIVMSESTRWDVQRGRLGEWIKQRYVALSSAALAGGASNAEYLEDLGFPRERVTLGYDIIENDYFSGQAAEARANLDAVRGELGLPARYFLASARFVAKKNLGALIDAFAEFRRRVDASQQRDLVLLGDGELRGELEAKIASYGLGEFVHMPGFKQYRDLPKYYAAADAFVHVSTTEQWGLVVNEAMACDLPVIISNRCGCAQDLVDEGANGMTFDPFNTAEIVSCLVRFAQLSDEERAAMGATSRQIIAAWGPDRFGTGLMDAAMIANEVGPKRAGLLDRLLLGLLARRTLPSR